MTDSSTSPESDSAETAKVERPACLPDKFKTVEALVASFKEAERKISSMGDQNAELRRLAANAIAMGTELAALAGVSSPE